VVVLALAGITQGVVAAPNLDEDLERAREILNLLDVQGEFETTEDYHARLQQYNSLLPELREIAEREYSVPLDIEVERYKPDAKYFPVTVSKEGLLEPAVGRLEMPISAARKAKAKINRAWGTVRVRTSTGLAQSHPHLTSLFVLVGGKQWGITFQAAWERGFTLPSVHPTGDRFSVTPDGKHLLVVSARNVLFVDLDSGDTRLSIAGQDCYAQDSHTAYVRQRGSIVVVDMESWSVRESRGGPSAPYGTYTSDGLLHVAWGDGGQLVLWDVQEEKPVWTIEAHESSIRDATFCGNDRFIATGSKDETGVKIWDADSGSLVRSITKHNATRVGQVLALTASDDHSYLSAATVSHPDETGTHAFVWDVPSFQDATPVYIHAGSIEAVAISPTSTALMFTYTARPGLNAVDATTGRTLQTFAKRGGYYLEVATSGNVMVGVGPAVETFWKVGASLQTDEPRPVVIGEEPGLVTTVVDVVATEVENTPTPATGTGPQITAYPTNEKGMQSAIARAEEILNIARPKDEFESTQEYEARIAEYNALIPELRAIAKLRFDVPMTVEDVGRYDADVEAFPVTIFKEGMLGAAQGTVRIPRSKARSAKSQLRRAWATVQIRVVPATREAIAYPEGISVRFQNKMWPVAFQSAWVDGYSIRGIEVGLLQLSPDSRFIAVGMRNHARIYRLSDGVEMWQLRPELGLPNYVDGEYGDLAFTHDGELLIEGSGAYVRIWDTASGRLRQTVSPSSSVLSLSTHPAGDLVAISSGTRVYILSVSQARIIGDFEAHSTWAHSVQFVEDGQFLVTGGGHTEANLRVWETNSWRHVRDLPNRPSVNGVYGEVKRLDSHDRTHRLYAVAWGTPTVPWDTSTWSRDTAISGELVTPDDETALGIGGKDGLLEIRVSDVQSQGTLQVVRPSGMEQFAWIPGGISWHVAADGSTVVVPVARQADGLIKTLWRVGANLADIPIEPLSPADNTSLVASATPEIKQPSEPQPGAPTVPMVAAPKLPPAEPTRPAQPENNAPASSGLVRTYALLVGVDDYDHHSNLVNPVNDVQTIQEELHDAYGSGTQTLANPTRREFQEALHALADRDYGEQDQLLVMFSGHGYFDERIKRGYLAFRDSLPLDEDPYFESYVSHGEVREILERLDCEHVLLIVDSCFAGTLDPFIAMAPGARPVDGGIGLIPAKQYIKRKLRFKTRRYITAGGKEYVPDGRPGQHSPFVRQLLAALRSYGGADGILTLEELTLYLERVDPQPRTGELFGNEPGSSFVLVANLLEEEEPAPKFAPLVVQVSPPDATVNVVGGPPAAESLLKTLRLEPTGTAERRYHLPLGTYRLRIRREGYTSVERDVVLSADGLRTEVTLDRR
jgi:WD40 repeat protein